jgi:cyanophycinase-like exopeptidase
MIDFITMNKISLHLIVLLVFLMCRSHAQNYTSYITGNSADTATIPLFGIALAGGATDNDQAMQWLLQRASGGDVLVLRASGSDGYNDYFFSDLGVPVHSVETIVCHNAQASYEDYIIEKIGQAELIFFAGGDQWNYISYWKDSPVEDAINNHMNSKQAPIGGTSAGMAILGGHYFSAENGTVYSEEALSNPYNEFMTIGHQDFLQTPFLHDVITDTHYDDPDRRGRHVAFLARIYADGYPQALGIACEEYTCVCIDETGLARAFGDYPEYDDYAYFIRHGCEDVLTPELCAPNETLVWENNENALYALKTAASTSGDGTFSLIDWQTFEGGDWQEWWVTDGVLEVNLTSLGPFCPLQEVNAISDPRYFELVIHPNPAHDLVNITLTKNAERTIVSDILGNTLLEQKIRERSVVIDIESLQPGNYFINVLSTDGTRAMGRFVVE